MTAEEIQIKCDEVATLMQQKLRLRGRSIAVTAQKARRDMPPKLRKKAAFLVDQATLAQSPKLNRMMDVKAIEDAHLALVDHLEAIDPKDRRRGAVLGWLGSVSFGLIVLAVAVVSVLVWRGFI
ncbi:hypothetical protein [Algirhabdus cladophorae]|uniref:hypothetical protein n=1 Tax=Algirhabdus cladophorae TaxID=3377108 RepID=UPI003B8452D1